MTSIIFNYADINRRLNRQPEPTPTPIVELPPPSLYTNTFIEMMEVMRREINKTMLIPVDLIGKRVTIRTQLPRAKWRELP
jgi:hypothetical protein